MKRIAIASDHAGFRMKEAIKTHLRDLGYELEDFGTHTDEPVDYPDFVRPAAESVASAQNDVGIVFGGSGNGEAMVASEAVGLSDVSSSSGLKPDQTDCLRIQGLLCNTRSALIPYGHGESEFKLHQPQAVLAAIRPLHGLHDPWIHRHRAFPSGRLGRYPCGARNDRESS